MAIAEDATTPGAKTGSIGSGTLTVTSNSFSPPSSSLLVAVVGIGHGPAGTPSVAVSDSGSHTWNTGPTVAGTDTWCGIWWTYLSSAPGSITVAAADSTSVGQSMQSDVRVLTGAASTQSGAASNTTSGTSQSWTGSLTPTKLGSWVYVCGCANEQSASISANANTTTLNNYQATAGSSVLSGHQSSGTGTTSLTSTTYGWTTTSASIAFAWAALEILPVIAVVPSGLAVGQSVKRAAYY